MKKYLASKVFALALVFAIFMGAASAHAEAWKFGIISDTQWTASDPANQNPNTVPASIIRQVDQQFINSGVKFVIAMGDQVDSGSKINDYTRGFTPRTCTTLA